MLYEVITPLARFVAAVPAGHVTPLRVAVRQPPGASLDGEALAAPTGAAHLRIGQLEAFALALFAPLAVTGDTLVIDGGMIHPVSGEPFVGRVVIGA